MPTRRRSLRWRRFVARHHGAMWARVLAKAGRTYLHAWQNLDYDIEHNGEREVLRRVAPGAGAVLLDVGANTGDWALVAVAEHPGTTVHAFEVVPATVDRLRQRTAGHPEVVVHDVGLGAGEAEVEVWVPARSSRGASTVRSEALGGEGSLVAGNVRRGDDVLAELGRPRVALLKIDVEGATLDVLTGFGSSLSDGLIDAVQFEWNDWTIEAGTTLRQHHLLLQEAGYDVGRLHPDGVAFAPYRPAEERTAAGNYVAARRDLRAVTDRLRAP